MPCFNSFIYIGFVETFSGIIIIFFGRSERKLTCKFCIWYMLFQIDFHILFITHNIHNFCFQMFVFADLLRILFSTDIWLFSSLQKRLFFMMHTCFHFGAIIECIPLTHLYCIWAMSSRMFVSFYFFALFCELLFSFVKYFSYIGKCIVPVFWDFCLL